MYHTRWQEFHHRVLHPGPQREGHFERVADRAPPTSGLSTDSDLRAYDRRKKRRPGERAAVSALREIAAVSALHEIAATSDGPAEAISRFFILYLL